MMMVATAASPSRMVTRCGSFSLSFYVFPRFMIYQDLPFSAGKLVPSASRSHKCPRRRTKFRHELRPKRLESKSSHGDFKSQGTDASDGDRFRWGGEGRRNVDVSFDAKQVSRPRAEPQSSFVIWRSSSVSIGVGSWWRRIFMLFFSSRLTSRFPE